MMKTGALINAAITTGAIMGGAGSEQIRIFTSMRIT